MGPFKSCLMIRPCYCTLLELQNACLTFAIGPSKLKLWPIKTSHYNAQCVCGYHALTWHRSMTTLSCTFCHKWALKIWMRDILSVGILPCMKIPVKSNCTWKPTYTYRKQDNDMRVHLHLTWNANLKTPLHCVHHTIGCLALCTLEGSISELYFKWGEKL